MLARIPPSEVRRKTDTVGSNPSKFRRLRMSIPSDVSRNPTADLGTSSGMAAVIRLLAPIDLPVYRVTIYIAHEYYTEYATTLYNFRYITILTRPFSFSFLADISVISVCYC